LVTKHNRREEEKERLRLEFASGAKAFKDWVKDTSEIVLETLFGDDLDEVEAFHSILENSNAAIRADADGRRADAHHIWEAMISLSVDVYANPYSRITIQDLNDIRQELDGVLEKRNHAYQAELAKQKANDQLCQEFAGLVKGFAGFISENKERISTSKEDLEAQLVNINHRLANSEADEAKIREIDLFYAKLEAANITRNKHTNLTVNDVRAQWDQFKSLLTKKQEIIKEEIELAKNQGLSPEQMEEIRVTFNTYDKNNNNYLDQKEFKACLFALGEELSKTRVSELYAEYSQGSSEHMTLQNFTGYMRKLYGDSDTKESTLQSFSFINKGRDVIAKEALDAVMKEEDVTYLLAGMRNVEGGFDYVQWTEEVYAR